MIRRRTAPAAAATQPLGRTDGAGGRLARRDPTPTRAELITVHGSRMRVGPWHGSTHTGQLALVGDGRPLTVDALRGALDHLAGLGYAHVNTGAVPELDVDVFSEAGFRVRERLHLLTHQLDQVGRVPRGSTRRARAQDRRAVLDVDAAAFDPFWRLDEAGLDESLTATPIARFRVTEHVGVSGYAVFGWAGDRGYLQRLAVRPDQWGQGLGELLVRDGLRWLKRRGADAAVVNTQERNSRGLALYQRLGFVLERHGLLVLDIHLTAPADQRVDGDPGARR